MEPSSQTNMTIQTAGKKKPAPKKSTAPDLKAMSLAQLKKLDLGVDGKLGEKD